MESGQITLSFGYGSEWNPTLSTAVSLDSAEAQYWICRAAPCQIEGDRSALDS